MSRLYIRNKEAANRAVFLHTPSEMTEFTEMYVPGRAVLIGDVSTFKGTMRSQLLKFIEENPSVDMYSSEDIPDPVLYSRTVEVIKEPLTMLPKNDVDAFFKSPRSHQDALQFLSGYSNTKKLLAPSLSQRNFRLIQ